jgi:hypothetical protein
MSTAIASGTWRRPTRRDLAILALAMAAHVVVLLALVSGARWMPQLVEPPAIEAELLDAPASRVATPTVSPSRSARPARTLPTPPPPINIPAVSVAKSSGPPAIVAPPGFTARKLVDESDATRESLRGSLGCRHEQVAALTKAEKAACAEADGLRSRLRRRLRQGRRLVPLPHRQGPLSWHLRLGQEEEAQRLGRLMRR